MIVTAEWESRNRNTKSVGVPKDVVCKLEGEDFIYMKSSTKVFFTVLTLAALSASSWAQATTPVTDQDKDKAEATAVTQPPVTAADIQALKDALAAQQRQIQALQVQLQSKDQALKESPSTGLAAAPPVASKASDSSAAAATNIQELSADKISQNAGSSDER